MKRKRYRIIGAQRGMFLDIFGKAMTDQQAEQYATDYQLNLEEVIGRIHKSHPNDNKLSPGRQLRAVASVAPSEESQTMFPPAPQEGGAKACQAISKQDSPARSRRAKGPTVKPRPPWARDVAHWLVRNYQTGLVSDRKTGASWDHAQQVLWCECGAQNPYGAPDTWEPGDVLTCRECSERWTIVGEKLDSEEV